MQHLAHVCFEVADQPRKLFQAPAHVRDDFRPFLRRSREDHLPPIIPKRLDLPERVLLFLIQVYCHHTSY
jgi:hypothetical protein